jgi:Flp pilus assembly protein TadG
MMRSRSKSEHGQSMVELALILPILVLMMIGLFDLGRIVFTGNALSDGARHGARHAATDPDDADYCSRVDAAIQSAIRGQPLSTYTVTYTTVDEVGVETGDYVLCEDGVDGPDKGSLPLTARPGDRVRVDLEASLDLITPFVAAATGRATFDLQSASTMQVTFVP